jgi:hypothetical protein
MAPIRVKLISGDRSSANLKMLSPALPFEMGDVEMGDVGSEATCVNSVTDGTGAARSSNRVSVYVEVKAYGVLRKPSILHPFTRSRFRSAHNRGGHLTGGTPKSRQIFLARLSTISLCRGMADRLLSAGLCHQEWREPSRRREHPSERR